MKVLWFCNSIPIKEISSKIGLPKSNGGGWIDGLYRSIANNPSIDLCVCFPLHTAKRVAGDSDGVKFFSFFQKTNLVGMPNFTRVSKRATEDIRAILKEVQPDIIHVFGTEFPHSVAAIKEFNNFSRTIIHIQGLAFACAEHYFADIPYKYIRKRNVASLFRGTIKKQQKTMLIRSGNERYCFRNSGYLCGRTDFDHSYCKMIAPKGRYLIINENLRESFYSAPNWSYSACKKHTIFVSQASYSIKGFHYLLNSLPFILAKYPDLHVYVGGRNPIKAGFLRRQLIGSTYGMYLYKLIKRGSLFGHITFLGDMDEAKMIKEYLSANVFLCCSSIENSPNSLCEAMILGVPCVSSDVGGIKSMVGNAPVHFYPHNDSIMLANTIISVFEEGNKMDQETPLLVARANEINDAKGNARAVIRLYEEVLKN